MIDLTNIDPFGMIDIADKESVSRTAEAAGRIILQKKTIEAIRAGKMKKGDPLAAAEIACIQAVKRTPDLIPLCHQVPISSVNTNFTLGEDHVEAWCRVSAIYKTGVEMEALMGVSVALLTVWDMVKYMEKDEEGQYPTTRISDIRVIEKRKRSK